MMTIATAIAVLGGLAFIFGGLLGYASLRFEVNTDPVIDQINAVLPQEQCGKCGYPNCYIYAKTIIEEKADINQCLPGGEMSLLALIDLLDRDPKALNSDCNMNLKMLAIIDESNCIGCTLCIQVCPVDAILGAYKYKHTVFAL